MPKCEQEIILIGGGGHCHSCIDVIESSGAFKIAGIVEQPGKNKENLILGYPIIGYDNDLAELRKQFDYALITIGQIESGTAREKLFKYLKELNFILPVIISPLAYVSDRAAIGEGTIVMHHVIVNAGAHIGNNCILNTKCLIEHDAVVGNYTHISTAAVLNGDSTIGSSCFVGSNAIIVNGAKLPEHYFFKAGTLIISKNNGKAIGENTL
jgi:sugar O-acyltransferase (sialic acid O-acetyltransferase NeuD family)